jgi:hypothetical protein
VLGPQGLLVQAESLHRPWHEVLHEHVRLREHRVQERAVLGVLDVERDALLAPVEPHEVAGHPLHRLVVAAGEVPAARTLDLDHACTEVGQLAGGEWGRHGLFQCDDGDALQWEH